MKKALKDAQGLPPAEAARPYDAAFEKPLEKFEEGPPTNPMNKSAEDLLKELQNVTPEQAAKGYLAVVDMCIADTVADIESLSREEVVSELRAAGRDPAVERAEAQASLERLRAHRSKL